MQSIVMLDWFCRKPLETWYYLKILASVKPLFLTTYFTNRGISLTVSDSKKFFMKRQRS